MSKRKGAVTRFIEDLDDHADLDRVVRRLDAALETTAESMRAVVPVRTGLLKSSGQAYSEHNADEWTGTIEFGAEPPVPYVEFVLNKSPNPYDGVVEAHSHLFAEALDYNGEPL